jgi:putative AbiEii toxin of type IV toxin-antitoxin system
MATRKKVLRIENFGPIRKVEVPFADITVLVGPQATGKSLVLQWLKLAVDQGRILGALVEHGFSVRGNPADLLGLIFGGDYADGAFLPSEVSFGGSRINLRNIAGRRAGNGEHRALFIPAHRALVMGNGWPLLFQQYGPDTPYVVREFSERVRKALTMRGDSYVFPPSLRRFPREIQQKLDETLFHGGTVFATAMDPKFTRELKLVPVDGLHLSPMEWTAGQREVLPLLAALYLALPSSSDSRRRARSLEWVIVEEPELGLHPDGVLAIMALLLEVARRGYRLVLSTHSQLVLDVLWSMQQLEGKPQADRKLLQILGLRDTRAMRAFAHEVLGKGQSITYLSFKDDSKVRSNDITSLDPFSPNEAVAQWGGLLEHSTRIADVLSSGQ